MKQNILIYKTLVSAEKMTTRNKTNHALDTLFGESGTINTIVYEVNILLF